MELIVLYMIVHVPVLLESLVCKLRSSSVGSVDCLQSVSLSFLYQNNIRKEHAGHEMDTRTARAIAWE